MKGWRLRMIEGTTLVYKLPKQRRYAYYNVTRKSVHRTRMPPPKAIQRPDTVYYMEQSQGRIIQRPKVQELSSLFMTHPLSVMHASVKFHEYIPYGFGVMARTRFTIWN